MTGNNTGIEAGLVKIFNTDITLAGTWNVAEAYPEKMLEVICDLLKTKESSNKNKSIRKWIVLFIGIMIIVSALVFCLNKYLM